MGEDLLQNTEDFAIAVGDVLTAAVSTNSTNQTRNFTIIRDNIGRYAIVLFYNS